MTSRHSASNAYLALSRFMSIGLSPVCAQLYYQTLVKQMSIPNEFRMLSFKKSQIKIEAQKESKSRDAEDQVERDKCLPFLN